MEVHEAIFRGSYPAVGQCPTDTRPEFAFIGRSNVGKSSLINMIMGRKDLARTSKKPGKTQLINYFLIDHTWFLVDLPGYGYAKVSKAKRKQWEKMIQDYLVKRESLCCTFVLIDSNIPPQPIDVQFVNWLGEMHLPFVIAYTKTDRVKPVVLTANLEAIRTALLEYWTALPQEFSTSAASGAGREAILAFIDNVNQQVLEESE